MQKSKEVLNWLQKYLRYVDYLSAAQLYLKDNFFLKNRLSLSILKIAFLVIGGTVPGQNFIYAHANYLISRYGANMMFISGPGHGAPAVFFKFVCRRNFWGFL